MSEEPELFSTVHSGSQTHGCDKKDCAYCDLMNRTDSRPNRKDGWTAWELAYLETNYGLMRMERMSEILNRSVTSIWRKKHDLNKLKKAA